ncbi:MAG: GNAT family protein [Methylococcales bacterium]|nr:GNAT family protein [Methylococcales bacterium]
MEHIYLREITRADITTTHIWRNDIDVVEGLSSTYRYVNFETEEQWFSNYQNNRSTQVRLAIVNKSDDVLIGMVSLVNIDFLSKTSELALQIGNKNFWGQGIGKFAIQAAIEHGFNNLNLNRIYLYVLTENNRAQAVYRSIGFKEEGILRQAIFKSGEYKDLILMSIIRNEYF